jgi:hypothetical protein
MGQDRLFRLTRYVYFQTLNLLQICKGEEPKLYAKSLKSSCRRRKAHIYTFTYQQKKV